MSVAQLNPREFEQFRGFIYEHSGIKIGDHKVSLLSNRIRQRVKACGLGDFAAYYRFLTSRQADAEFDFFLDAVTTNETFFLRTPEHFQWFGEEFIQECSLAALRGPRPKRLRIWSSACSSGEEPYSLALCLVENGLKLRGWDMRVTATDISQAMLSRAQAGRFKQRALDKLNKDQLRRYFSELPGEGLWEIKPALQKLVEFRQHNLLERAVGGPYDCVFLRNVLIYFDADSKRRVIHNITSAVAPGGYLVLGPSEGAWDLLEGFERQKPWLYRRPMTSDEP